MAIQYTSEEKKYVLLKGNILKRIAWALGGERYKPSQATREGSVIPPTLHIVMNNGLVVERKGKNSALKVIDPNGQKAGQQLLNEFVEQLALDLPKFMEASGAEKAKILLQIIGVGPQLTQLEQQENPSRLSRMPGVQRGEKKQFIVDTNLGKASWNEWYEWIEGVNDDLPEPEGLESVWDNLPELSPCLIEGILRKGHKMLIAGPSKAGKSFLQIELCIAIAEGKKWLKWYCAQGRVMYVNLELDRASCLHRFKDVYTSMESRRRTFRTLISGICEANQYQWISLHLS